MADFKWPMWHSWIGSGLSQASLSWLQYTMLPSTMWPCRTNISKTQFHAQQIVSVCLQIWDYWTILNVTVQGNIKHSAWHIAGNNEYWPLPFKDNLRLKIQTVGDPWVAQRFSACLLPRAWSWSPGIQSHIGLPAWSLLLPLPVSLPVSLSLCLPWINK